MPRNPSLRDALRARKETSGTTGPQDHGTDQPPVVPTTGPQDTPQDTPQPRSVRDYTETPSVQIGVRVPAELHELAEVMYFPHRKRTRKGAGVVYTALLELARRDPEVRAWVDRWVRGEE